MIKVGIAGCTGKMGRALVQEIMASNDMVLTTASVSAHHTLEIDVGTLAGVKALDVFPVHNLIDAIHDFDLLIDFTNPDTTLSHIALCVQHRKKMVIGTTGLSQAQKEVIKEASKTIPIVFAPNMSVGLNICLELVQTAAQKMGQEADIHISEAHHRHKKDNPSGTSLKIEEAIHQVLPDKAISHSSIRAGEIVGDHTVLFALAGESVEITHKAFSRNIFAKGALRASRWLNNQPVGLYSMQDVLSN